jgi:hypothetical protein
MIQNAKGLEIDTQKIISKGAAAADGQTMADLGIKEGEFVVVMSVKVDLPVIILTKP